MATTYDLKQQHLDKIRAFYDAAPVESKGSARHYRALLAHYYNLLIPANASVLEIGCGSGELLAQLKASRKAGVDLSEKQIQAARARLPDAEFHVQTGEALALVATYDVIIISDTLNFAADVQMLLAQLHAVSHADTRLLINYHSSLWRPLFYLGQLLSLKSAQPQSSWLDTEDVHNLLRLSDWSPLLTQPRILLPVPLFGLDRLVNRWLAPLLGWFCLTVFCVARRANLPRREPKLVSVVVPARNEAGSIRDVLERVPRLGEETELIIIEGNSTDNTWQVIQHLPDVFHAGRIVKLKQTGKGKGNAVREAFAYAKGDIVTILDADLTMPPEDLPNYIEVLASRKADFANGVRLVYPMDDQAMQFANLCANKAFSLIFSWLLGQPVKDTLCGTKAMWREDYQKLDANRAFFGDFDPFGDFDLLFGADKLNLKIRDVPIRYKERFYGQTNISRWKHGVILLGMVLFAAKRLKFV